LRRIGDAAVMNELFTHIAVCLDNSKASAAALDEAWRLKQSVGPVRFSVVHVIPSPIVVAGHGAMWVQDPNEIAAGAKEWLDAVLATHPGAEMVLLGGYPQAEVCDWAREEHVDLLVASSSRGMFDRVLLGSFAGYLARHAPCSVLLTRPHVVPDVDEDTALASAKENGS
jgi:nucleotide-binding universal stress UspA family protein